MPKTRLPTAFTNRLKKLDSETQKPVVTDEVIKSYCVLDEPTMYVRLSKPCKFICLCGQPHNSLAEAKAHIVGKGCQFLFHWVRLEPCIRLDTRSTRSGLITSHLMKSTGGREKRPGVVSDY